MIVCVPSTVSTSDVSPTVSGFNARGPMRSIFKAADADKQQHSNTCKPHARLREDAEGSLRPLNIW